MLKVSSRPLDRSPILSCFALLAVMLVPTGTVSALATPSDPEPASSPVWTVVERLVIQDMGHWQVEYRLRLEADTPLNVLPEDVVAHIEAWVSNSRVPAHAAPRQSSVTLSGPAGLVGATELIASNDDARRCRERVRLAVWPADEPAPPLPNPSKKPKNGEEATPPPSALHLAPGGELRVRLRFEHEHFLHGPYDPLLGARDLELKLGSTTFRDVLPLDREYHLALPPVSLPPAPPDRLDPRFFVSAPDSLHLEAHVPGNASYRLPEQPVRYGTRMRLSYWYLIALGTEGECRIRVQQYRDAPNSWKILSEGSRDEILPVVGRWVRAEVIFRTEAEATSLSIDFRIANAEIGELWIDDVVLEPVCAALRP